MSPRTVFSYFASIVCYGNSQLAIFVADPSWLTCSAFLMKICDAALALLLTTVKLTRIRKK